jgi:hypothetical protein
MLEDCQPFSHEAKLLRCPCDSKTDWSQTDTPESARYGRATVDLARLVAATIKTLLADHVQQRRGRMNPLQQGSIQLAGNHPTRRVVRVLFDKRSPVLPASFELILQSGSNPSTYCAPPSAQSLTYGMSCRRQGEARHCPCFLGGPERGHRPA